MPPELQVLAVRAPAEIVFKFKFKWRPGACALKPRELCSLCMSHRSRQWRTRQDHDHDTRQNSTSLSKVASELKAHIDHLTQAQYRLIAAENHSGWQCNGNLKTMCWSSVYIRVQNLKGPTKGAAKSLKFGGFR